ncbi:hypothetical protein [Streptomyces mirabilis]|uniref:hypothetical protein n=1 Tax=Streptomyces mirabilis TaxID=68239 RepID=UPI0036673648
MSDVVFTADFASTRQWVAGHSWACPDGGPVNPDADKLDYLVPDHRRTGTFRATRRPDGRWNTGHSDTVAPRARGTVASRAATP